MPDLARFEVDLAALVHQHGVAGWCNMRDEGIADTLTRFVVMLKHAREQGKNVEFRVVDDEPRFVRGTNQPMVPQPAKIEVRPGTADHCACAWSDEPHLRSDHEPTQPHDFVPPIPLANMACKFCGVHADRHKTVEEWW